MTVLLHIAVAGMTMGFAQLSSRAPPSATPADANEHAFSAFHREKY